MSDRDICDLIGCYDMDGYYKKVLIKNIPNNKELVINAIIEYSLSRHLKVISNTKINKVMNFLEIIKREEENVDKNKLTLLINKLKYYCIIIGYTY